MGKDAPSPAKKVDELYELIEGIEVAMMTTRRADGHLVSRPMATQKRTEGADLWFVTDIDTHKLDELAHDPHVNVSYYKDRTREWVSVSGVAEISQDREEIRKLWAPDWKAWFPKEGGARDGGPDDPRFALIKVQAESVVYMLSNKPAPVVLFEVVKAIVTGDTAEIGEVREVSKRELSGSR